MPHLEDKHGCYFVKNHVLVNNAIAKRILGTRQPNFGTRREPQKEPKSGPGQGLDPPEAPRAPGGTKPGVKGQDETCVDKTKGDRARGDKTGGDQTRGDQTREDEDRRRQEQ